MCEIIYYLKVFKDCEIFSDSKLRSSEKRVERKIIYDLIIPKSNMMNIGHTIEKIARFLDVKDRDSVLDLGAV
jgi:hypothetical protein